MKNKGFTLIELLVTIAVLAIITSIAVMSITKISSIVKVKHRENKINRIEVAAAKYAYDTGKNAVFVSTLVKEGYLETDDGNNVIDPVDNSLLNCYVVTMEKQGTYYVASFNDSKDYTNAGTCDDSNFTSDYASVDIEVYQNNNKVEDTTKWLTGNLNLRATSQSLNLDCTNVANCRWTSTSGYEKSGDVQANISLTNVEVNSRYTFQYRDANSKTYTDSIDLKIDNLAPNITNATVLDNGVIRFNIVENGSGLDKICINKKSRTVDDCAWASIGNYLSKYDTQTVSNSGSYYAHVKDKAGNIGHSSVIVVNLNDPTSEEPENPGDTSLDRPAFETPVYLIIEGDEDCATAIEYFWQENGCRYFFTCRLSQSTYVMKNNTKYLLVYALENNIVTIDELESYGYSFKKECDSMD